MFGHQIGNSAVLPSGAAYARRADTRDKAAAERYDGAKGCMTAADAGERHLRARKGLVSRRIYSSRFEIAKSSLDRETADKEAQQARPECQFREIELQT